MSLLDGFEVVPLSGKDRAVKERAAAFFERMGLVKPERPDVVKWFGLAKDGVISLVVSIFVRRDESIEVLDFYPAPTRTGIRAGYVALRLLKAAVDCGEITYWIGNIVWRNKTGQRRAEKYFGIEPTAILYQYEGAKA